MANIEYLDRLIEWAAEEDAKRSAGLPSHWDQGEWIQVDEDPTKPPFDPNCGTACCIAGRVALEGGALPRLVNSGYDDEMHWSSVNIVLPDGTETDVEAFATQRLGLTGDQAVVLFGGGNDLDDLRRIVAAIKAGRTDYDGITQFDDTEDEED